MGLPILFSNMEYSKSYSGLGVSIHAGPSWVDPQGPEEDLFHA